MRGLQRVQSFMKMTGTFTQTPMKRKADFDEAMETFKHIVSGGTAHQICKALCIIEQNKGFLDAYFKEFFWPISFELCRLDEEVPTAAC
jgi:hypothetical protein